MTPLGLRDSIVTMTAEQRKRFAQGHTAMGDATPPWEMPTLVGAGGLRSTARELLAFLDTCLAKCGPMREATGLCTTPRGRSGRPGPSLVRFAVAAGLAGVLVGVTWLLEFNVPLLGVGGLVLARVGSSNHRDWEILAIVNEDRPSLME